jgi:hypothetical protein
MGDRIAEPGDYRVPEMESSSLIRVMLREAMDDFSAIEGSASTDINPLPRQPEGQPEGWQLTCSSANNSSGRIGSRVIMATGIIVLGVGLFAPDLLRHSIGARYWIDLKIWHAVLVTAVARER